VIVPFTERASGGDRRERLQAQGQTSLSLRLRVQGPALSRLNRLRVKTRSRSLRAQERHKAPRRAIARHHRERGRRLYQEHAEHLPSWPTIRYLLEALVYGLGQNKLLSTISQRDLQIYFAKRRADRSNASVNREIENARAVWRYAKASEYDIGKMPNWAQLTLKVPTVAPRELEIEEEAGLFLALRHDVSDAVDFLLKSGWRRAEVLGLRWSDVSFPRKSAVTRIKGGDVVVRPLTTPSSKFWRGNPVARMPKARPSCSPMSARKAVAIAARANAIP
jgi:integrase